VDVGAADEEGARVGWPTAAPGTPAARLRLEAAPEGREAGSGRAVGPEADAPPPRPRSAWDPPEDGHGRGARWAARWLPGSWVGARWDPGRTGALALAAVAAVAAVVAAVGVWSERPVAEPVPALPVVAPAVDPGSGPPGLQAAPAAGPIVVSVSGRVRHPGLLRLPPGSRVGEAIDAAGGAEPDTDLTGLNLAARLADGEQILVGVPVPVTPPVSGPSAGAAQAPSGSAAPAPSGRLDLNSATLEQLDQLPGVGPVTAQRILEWRTQNGRFAAVEQLQEVSGIGEARFATLRELVSV
jgi:competence protein ComEA